MGVNAAADATNRLSLRSAASLFSHEGSDHRLSINKNDSADTGSIIFQSGFSGRAEIGLTGDDDFRINVSTNGETWLTAMIIDSETGTVLLPNSNDAVSVNVNTANRLEPTFRMTGTSRDGSEDQDEGVGLYLTHNSNNNRQFVLADTATLRGVRFLGNTIDGYTNGARADLRLGSNTHGAHVASVISNTQFSVSNHGGTPSKTVAAFAGHASQTGDLLQVSTQHVGAQGDALKVRADKVSEFGAALKLASYSIAALPPANEAGSMIFVSDTNNGGAPAFSDGSVWKRVSDGVALN